jgi:hypothetical protein
MLGGFWTSIGGKLADRWATVSAGALVYWLGAVAAWLIGHGGLRALEQPLDRLAARPAPVQVAVLIAALLAVTGSGVVVQALTQPVIRAMEGYWPRWLSRLRAVLVHRAERRYQADERRWNELSGGPAGMQDAGLARLDQRLRRRPENRDLLMPTTVGNILRAAESHPADKYGLDAVAVWPHLWLVLPDSARQEIAAARSGLDGAARLFLWGLLFLPFVALTWLAVPVGLAVAAAALWWRAPATAAVYGDLVEAAYDLHRPALYRQLRWPLPTDPQQERSEGRRLTTYLWRGLDTNSPTFRKED